ncbi:MAG: efflux RND transporter periplasmic adaptor subunit [Acidobacteria bacterium]|nr:efflux RND transporter periplasmic adaptor subunit [Acidobacteriota bacterium]
MKKIIILTAITASLLGAFYLLLRPETGLLVFLKQGLMREKGPAAKKIQDSQIEYWTCTMHPSVRMPEPGTCPICSMDLVPVQRAMPEAPLTPSLTVSDPSVFLVDPGRRQLLNVQTSLVVKRPLEKTIRTVGTLELDETRIESIHTKVKGWISEVFVDFELEHVKQGDPLFSIYSPELVSTQQEYLLALKTSRELGGSRFENVSSGARSLLEATRKRLELFDLTPVQIRELEQTERVRKDLIVYSPVTGHVIRRNAFRNMYVTPETEVYTVADHTHIWAQVRVYENEIGYVSAGQAATMRIPAYPGQVFVGRISYIYPHLDPDTRTMNVRLEFSNPDLRLKPGMYAHVEIRIPSRDQLAVPDSAVLRTGKRDLVLVDLGEGRMQLRQVEIGDKFDGHYEVLRGLKPGERVVTAANFLLDAESRVQGVEAVWETPKPRGPSR